MEEWGFVVKLKAAEDNLAQTQLLLFSLAHSLSVYAINARLTERCWSAHFWVMNLLFWLITQKCANLRFCQLNNPGFAYSAQSASALHLFAHNSANFPEANRRYAFSGQEIP
jgi:hypothetical protein